MGWYKLCILNQSAQQIFDAGTVEVTSYFQKSGMDMFDTRRTFVLPCVTDTKNSAGKQVWDSPLVWLPDGTGLWTVKVIPGSEKSYSTLDVSSSHKTFREFPVCATLDSVCLASA